MTPMQEVEILRACCCVAGANGECSESERTILEQLAVKVGVGKASFDAILERGLTDPEFHKQQLTILKSEPEQTMEVLLSVAMADRDVTVAEATVLQNLANNLELDKTQFDAIAAKVAKRS